MVVVVLNKESEGVVKISHKYNFKEFVDCIAEYVNQKDIKHIQEIFPLIEEECYEAERKMAGGVIGAPRAREEGCPEYVNLLKGLLFFLRYEIKPNGVSDQKFQSFKPVIEGLVEKGVMKSGVLRFFR